MCAAAPMLFTYAADERCTGSFDTSARQTPSAGNTPHAAAGVAEAAGLGLAAAVRVGAGAGVAEPDTNAGAVGAAAGAAPPQAVSPNAAVSAARRNGDPARERESTRRI
jgi:hypothetical protein